MRKYFIGILSLTQISCGLPNPFSSHPEDVIRLSGPEYAVSVQSGRLFGIISLKLDGQQTDFSHEELPLDDWEWFKFEFSDEAPRANVKLLQSRWEGPVVQGTASALAVLAG